MLEGVLDPILMYGCETHMYVGQVRSKIRVAEMHNLFNIVGIKGIDRMKSDVRKLWGKRNL